MYQLESTENTNTLPRMRTIQQIADETGFSYRYISGLCKTNKIVHIRVGVKYFINFDKFIEYLNTGEQN